MFKVLKQSMQLSLPFLFVLVWQITILKTFTLELIAILIILYLILSATKRRQKDAVFFGGFADIFIFTSVVVLLVITTGSFDSGIFFLLYFLLFGISFVFEPATVFLYVLYIFGLFTLIGVTFENDVTSNLIKLGSIALLSPLAFFFGRQLKKEDDEADKLEALEERTKDSADVIAQDIEEVLHKEKHLTAEEVDKLGEVLEETEQMRKKV